MKLEFIAIQALKNPNIEKNGIHISDKETFQHKLVSELEELDEKFRNEVAKEIMYRILPQFPPELSEKDMISSVIKNITYDLSQVNMNVPPDFTLNKEQDGIHTGNTNQFRIHYNREMGNYLSTGEKIGIYENSPVAFIGFQFLERDKKEELRIQTIQGELKTNLSCREEKEEIKNTFRKLSNHYEMNWRAGLAKELKEYGESENLRVFGEVPGVFSLFGPNIEPFPRYSMYMIQSYFEAGFSSEQIYTGKVQKTEQPKLDKIISSVEELSPRGRKKYFAKATSIYSQYASVQKDKCYNKHEISIEQFHKKCLGKFKELSDVERVLGKNNT